MDNDVVEIFKKLTQGGYTKEQIASIAKLAMIKQLTARAEYSTLDGRTVKWLSLDKLKDMLQLATA